MQKINVTVRIEPDRWTGEIYDGQVRKTGFTNPSKGIEDYVIISHAGYKAEYLDDVWDAVKSKATSDPTAAGLGYIGIAESDAGDYSYFENAVTLADLPNDPNYSVQIDVRPGRLQILKKPVTVTTASASKVYDGTPLTKTDGYTVTGIVDGETYGFEVTGTRTEFGISENTYAITWKADGNNYTAKQSNYDVTEKLGNLEVTAGTLSITIKNKYASYTGSEQYGYDAPTTVTGTGSTINTDEYVIDGLAEGHVLTISGYTPSSGTAVGTYNNGSFADATTITVHSGETDVTNSYSISTTPGKLIINKKVITIESATDTWTYDGSAHQNTKVTVTSGSLATGDTLVAVATGSVTNVSDSGPNPIAKGYKIMHGEEDVTANYTITAVAGRLTITARPVTFTGKSETKEYTGSTITINTVEVTATAEGVGLVRVDTHNVTFSASGIEADTYPGTITA